jgi:hypothetical protein
MKKNCGASVMQPRPGLLETQTSPLETPCLPSGKKTQKSHRTNGTVASHALNISYEKFGLS